MGNFSPFFLFSIREHTTVTRSELQPWYGNSSKLLSPFARGNAGNFQPSMYTQPPIKLSLRYSGCKSVAPGHQSFFPVILKILWNDLDDFSKRKRNVEQRFLLRRLPNRSGHAIVKIHLYRLLLNKLRRFFHCKKYPRRFNFERF